MHHCQISPDFAARNRQQMVDSTEGAVDSADREGCLFCLTSLVAAKDQRFERKDQRLKPKQHRVDDADGIYRVQGKAFHGANLVRREQFMIAGICIDDTAAACRYAIQPISVQWLEVREDCPWAHNRLNINQLFATA